MSRLWKNVNIIYKQNSNKDHYHGRSDMLILAMKVYYAIFAFTFCNKTCLLGVDGNSFIISYIEYWIAYTHMLLI